MSDVILGSAAVVFYLVHAAVHFRRGHPAEALWVCHLAALITGVGMLVGSREAMLTGVLWLSVGVPLWILETSRGQRLLPTSALTHFGGIGVGLVGLAQAGVPEGTWWKATAAMTAMHVVSRFITSGEDNVNFAHRVHPLFAARFESVNLFAAAIMTTFLAYFFVVERLLLLIWPG